MQRVQDTKTFLLSVPTIRVALVVWFFESIDYVYYQQRWTFVECIRDI